MDKTQKTIIAYDKNSKVYAEKFMNSELYIERIKEFIEFLKVKDIVLDLGCGPGNVAKQLDLCGKDISATGIDLSEEMIALARLNVPGSTFYCQDIRDIEFKEKSFDAIILSFCIVHLSDEEMAFILVYKCSIIGRNFIIKVNYVFAVNYFDGLINSHPRGEL
ncbi:MAG: class I SAM-dependent methyltransferase [Desulfosporosinus sp.]|nr:class I SAM-dependent methyltransferase [Desulfosporosinus sp.]